MVDGLKDTMLEIWAKKGFSRFKETIWRSSLQQSDLPTIRSFLTSNNINNVDISLVIPTDNNTPRMNWIKYYDRTGQCISSLSEELIPVNSNNIKLTFCYDSELDEKDNEVQVIHVVNILRLVFGVPIARELVVIRRYSNDANDAVRSSDTGFSSFFDTQSLNIFKQPPIEKLQIEQVSVEAMILLDKAFSQIFPTERFVLMWLAFESIINTFSGSKNNGNKREKFCKENLKSIIINEEVYRLFKVRCNMFKEGKLGDLTLEKECWSLYAVIQLSIMKNCEQRQAFVSGFEDILLSKLSD